jgi:hypothetical protein
MKTQKLALGVLATLSLWACGDDDSSDRQAAPGSTVSDGGSSADGSMLDGGPGLDSDGAPLPTGKFRIGTWCGMPMGELTKERFDEAAGAGLTTISCACEGPADTPAYSKAMLSLAKGVGLDVIVNDSRIMAAFKGTDIDANLDAVIADFAAEPALVGYHVTDEPGATAFPALAKVVSGLLARDPKHFPYINLFPDYAPLSTLGTPSYDAYVEQYLAVVKPPVFSFDYYPFRADGSDEPGFFRDLAIVRAHGLATKTPFWQFVQSISADGYRKTSGPEKLWVGTQTLAYGGVGVSYFTYWTPPLSAENFGSGIIDSAGHRTEQYDQIKANNARLSAFGRYLVAAKSTAVFHNGALASGTVPREPGMPVYVPSAAPITVGLFAAGATGGDVYGFVANRDYTKATETDVYLASTAAAPEVLDVASGKFVPMKVEAQDAIGTKVHVAVEPGDGVLIHLRGPVLAGPPGAEAFIGVVRGNAGTLDVVDKSFGAARINSFGWEDQCPAGYAFAGRDFQTNGFWLCVRKDLAGRNFLVGNVVAGQSTLFDVKGGTATSRGASTRNTCPNAALLGQRDEDNGFWVCLE